jgi:Saxitoxin biosynthesis operon protein SxtJ
MSGSHEDYDREHQVEGSSNRSFGLVMAAACAFFAFSPKFKGHDPRLWLLGPGGVFTLAALAFPKVLGPLNFLWTKLGLLLGKITTPIVLFIFFYVILTPVALLMRLTGKDPMRSKRAAPGKSYWIERTPPGPAPETLRNQF